MGQPFEIVYAPIAWGGTPYGGLHVQAPANQIQPQFTPSMSNFILRNYELRSRPRFVTAFGGTPANDKVLALGSFFSRGKTWHTFAFRDNNAAPFYEINAALAWVNIAGSCATQAGIPVSWFPFRGVLYWTDSLAHVSAWDGAAVNAITDIAFTGAVSPPIAGQTTFGAKYIGELADHIVLASTIEQPVGGAATSFMQRIRWSNTGFEPFDIAGTFGANLGTVGATFDPTINVNAGLADFLEVPDVITGMMMMGRVGYLLRSNGITEMSPTGSGTAPFAFNHLWASQYGIGNIYAYGWAQYGNLGVILSVGQVYKLEPYGMTPIGGGARDAIMWDLYASPSPVRACITPLFNFDYTYLCYMLFIAGGPTNGQTGNTIVYVYSFEDNNWVKWILPGVAITGVPTLFYVGANSGSPVWGSIYG